MHHSVAKSSKDHTMHALNIDYSPPPTNEVEDLSKKFVTKIN
jgi:hypothetical protein